jgi:hypothetical protein
MLLIKRLSDQAVIPTRGSALAAGLDLSAAKAVVIPARGKAIVPTDLAMSMPDDVYGRIAPRSGLAWKHHLDVGAGYVYTCACMHVGMWGSMCVCKRTHVVLIGGILDSDIRCILTRITQGD